MKVQKRSKMLSDSMLHKTVRGKGRTENLSTHRSSVRDAVKNVKKMLEQRKRSQSESMAGNTKRTVNIKVKRPWKFRSSRGVVYVGHIPHGFYEEQMQEYFKQFGNVTRVRVARSKNTGRSRGYGYVEFSNNEVAKIAAETMNNYLMCGRLLKATYVPPEKQHAGFFSGKNWTENEYPKLRNRELSVLQKNGSIKGEVDYIAYTKNVKRNLVTLEKKLEARGIKLNFKPAGDVET